MRFVDNEVVGSSRQFFNVNSQKLPWLALQQAIQRFRHVHQLVKSWSQSSLFTTQTCFADITALARLMPLMLTACHSRYSTCAADVLRLLKHQIVAKPSALTADSSTDATK